MANLRIAELDFDEIKANLKDFLKSQSEFSDYDFEGSALSVLIDILAYNTHYNAYLANMVVNEMFLDSAVKRSSAVSLAKHLGYMPRSARGAKAIVDVIVDSAVGTPSYLTIPRYSAFTTSVNNNNYTFLNIKDYTTEPVDGVYTFSDVEIIQGTLLSFDFEVQQPGPAEKYVIPNDNVDTTTIQVIVQKSSTDLSAETYTKAESITELDSTSKVYFIEETSTGFHQIYFGDGILGRLLETGNIIRVNYLVTDGSAANVSNLLDQSITFTGTIGGSSPIVNVIVNSTGGAAKESLDSIKFNALRFNSAKGRLVNKNDYAAYIKNNFSEVESVSVWGGEENTPPVYGKVFISLKPYNGFSILPQQKELIKNILLKNRQVMTVSPVIIDPEILYTGFTGTIKYNPNLTTKTGQTILNEVRTAVENYFYNNLQIFEKNFYFSEFLNILHVDKSIVGFSIEPRIQRRITPVLSVENSFISSNTIKFYNRIHPNEILSTRFFITSLSNPTSVRIRDVPNTTPPDYNGTGVLQLYDDINDAVVSTNIGTVNYLTGELSIAGIVPVGFTTGEFDISISANLQSPNYDVMTSKNVLIALDDSNPSSLSGRTTGIQLNIIPI